MGTEQAGAQGEMGDRGSPAVEVPPAMPSAPDLLPMQLLLLPEFLHFLGFLTKGLSQLDVTLSHIVYLCKEKKYTYIYIPKKALVLARFSS